MPNVQRLWKKCILLKVTWLRTRRYYVCLVRTTKTNCIKNIEKRKLRSAELWSFLPCDQKLWNNENFLKNLKNTWTWNTEEDLKRFSKRFISLKMLISFYFFIYYSAFPFYHFRDLSFVSKLYAPVKDKSFEMAGKRTKLPMKIQEYIARTQVKSNNRFFQVEVCLLVDWFSWMVRFKFA